MADIEFPIRMIIRRFFFAVFLVSLFLIFSCSKNRGSEIGNSDFNKYGLSFSYPASFAIVEETGDESVGSISLLNNGNPHDRIYLMWMAFDPELPSGNTEKQYYDGVDLYFHMWIDSWTREQKIKLIETGPESFVIPKRPSQLVYTVPMELKEEDSKPYLEKIVISAYEEKGYLFAFRCFYSGDRVNGKIVVLSANSLISLKKYMTNSSFIIPLSEVHKEKSYIYLEKVMSSFNWQHDL